MADRTAELGLPLILINPSVKSAGGENLGSLGAYAIGLSDFLRTFEYAYYLRTLDWGVILRKYPDGFQIYNQVGPECVVTMWRRGMRSVVNRLLRFHSFISGRAAQVRADRDAQQHAIGRQARRDIFIRLSGGGDRGPSGYLYWSEPLPGPVHQGLNQRKE